jgi:sugar phosphate isomerase/epimerase
VLSARVVTYCTNIHPGETWDEVFANLSSCTLRVKERVCPDRPFPVGLRLSARAAAELGEDGALRFRDWCQREDLFVHTLNGFPYGPFHGRPVKEEVYQPDWRFRERLEYTTTLARLLAQWLSAGTRGSISTVPVGFRRSFPDGGLGYARRHLIEALETLDALAQTEGREILLSLEPEPGCFLETTEELVRFFDDLRPPASLSRYLGVCYDCCHQSLQFEEPAHSLRLLSEAGIPIGHVQVSSALRLRGSNLEPLRRFAEPVYLHQAIGRRADGSLLRFDDLPPALAAAPIDIEEWRVHFHVPVFVSSCEDCETTQPFLEEILPLFCPDTTLEVETYTWNVLPPELQTPTVAESIVRELEWVGSRLPAP